jgi:FtsZ-binding cell division protein ZapB
MFFGKVTPPILSINTEHKLDLCRPSSPTDSVMSTVPSLAPSQASKTSIFGRWQRTTPAPSVISVATSPEFTDSELSIKNSMLQAQLEQLQEVSTINRTTLQQLADDLEGKDTECAKLRNSVNMLDAMLEQAALSPGADAATSPNAELEVLQEKLEFANACRRTLKRSLREKEQEIVTLQETLDGCAAHGNNTASAALDIQSCLKNARDTITDLQLTIQGKDEQLSTLHSELDSTKISHGELVNECDDLSRNVTTQQDQLTSLRIENDVLANRAAAAEATVNKFKSHVSTFTQQFQSLATISASSQAKYQGQIEGMYAQQQLAEQQSAGKLQAQSALIAELEQRLDDAVNAKLLAAQHRDDEVLSLKDHISRLTLDLDNEEVKAEAWQRYANVLCARLAELAGQEDTKEKSSPHEVSIE